MNGNSRNHEQLKTYIVMNPLSGRMEREPFQEKMKEVLAEYQVPHEILETAEVEQIEGEIKTAIEAGYKRFVAVGGDGTVSNVASGLVGTDLPLVIIPAGTGNILAKDLNIPQELNKGISWWPMAKNTKTVDAMKIWDKYYFLNCSIGLSSKALAEVTSEDKQDFGWWAYFVSGLQGLSEVTSDNFRIQVDGETIESEALEVFIANSGIVQFENVRIDPEIKIDDGVLSLCIVQAKTVLDYFKVASEIILENPTEPRLMQCQQVRREVIVDAEKELPVQADGDQIGFTPVTIQLVPSAVHFVIPNET